MPTRSFRGIRVIKFDDFELDVRAAELRRAGERVRLQEQPYRLLTMLLERPGEVVLREEIQRRLWPNDTVVEVGHGINAAVLRLRDALGESADNPKYVETLARRGYRFRGTVEVVDHRRSVPTPSLEPDCGTLDGQTVSHFRVLEKLGGGGMGVVYRAEDLKLGRQVALKVLPGELARDPVALGRFQREARAASALNHPNICTVHGVEEWSGQPVIVMELLEGETLEARLSQGPLSIEKALPVAIQMVAALDAAHRKGIVHRDLKPGNVLLTESGAKVLDFGLAKMTGGGAADAEVTRDGSIMGTLHYMSPEQVQGKDAGPASDIFSFGLVVYEMIAGRRAYAGEDSAAVMASILTEEPPAIDAPEVLAPILRRCLAKDPVERWQSARDLKAALEWIRDGWRPGAAVPVPETPTRRIKWMAAGIAVALLGMGLIAWMARRDWQQPVTTSVVPPTNSLMKAVAFRNPPGALSRRTITDPSVDRISKVELSPDGKQLAFVSGSRLHLRGIDSGESRTIEGVSGNGTPFWSPDGKYVAEVANGKLTVVNAQSGAATIVGQVNTALGGAWGTDGSILIGAIGDGIWKVNTITGDAVRVTELNREGGESRHLTPQFLPDGRHFLFIAGSPAAGASTLYAASLDSKKRTRIMTVASNVVFVSSGRKPTDGVLVWAQDHILTGQRFDAAALKTVGEPFSIGRPVRSVAAAGAAVSVADFSAAGGELAYLEPAGGGITVVKNWLSEIKQ